MSIIRVGLAQTKKFAEGYDAIFGKKTEETKPEEKKPETSNQEEKKEEAKQQ